MIELSNRSAAFVVAASSEFAAVNGEQSLLEMPRRLRVLHHFINDVRFVAYRQTVDVFAEIEIQPHDRIVMARCVAMLFIVETHTKCHHAHHRQMVQRL